MDADDDLDFFNCLGFLNDSLPTAPPGPKDAFIPGNDSGAEWGDIGSLLTLESSQLVRCPSQPNADDLSLLDDSDSFGGFGQLPQPQQQQQQRVVIHTIELTQPPPPPPPVQFLAIPINEEVSIPSVDSGDVAVDRDEEVKRRKREAVRKCRSNKKQKTNEMQEDYEKCKAENERLTDENRQLKLNADRVTKQRDCLDKNLHIAGETIQAKEREIQTLKVEIDRLMKNEESSKGAVNVDVDPSGTVEVLMREVERLRGEKVGFVGELERLKKECSVANSWNSSLTLMLRDYQNDTFF